MTFGTTPKDNAQVPLGSVYVPGTANSDLTALEGIAINTDGNGQKSSGARLGMLDGDHVSFGAKADAVATSDTGTFTLLALFKRLLQKYQSTSTPMITEDQIRALIAAGKGFAVTTGPIVLGAAANIPLSIFNVNTNSVNVLIFSIVYSNAATNGSDTYFKYTTTDPAYGTNPAYQNLKAGGAASGLPSSAVSYVSTTQTAPTAPFLQYMRIPTGSNQEALLTPNTNILLPQGSSNGLTIWQNPTGATTIGMSIMWVEF